MNVDSRKVVEIIKKHTDKAFESLSEEEKHELKVVFADVIFDISLYIIEESEKLNGNVGLSKS